VTLHFINHPLLTLLILCLFLRLCFSFVWRSGRAATAALRRRIRSEGRQSRAEQTQTTQGIRTDTRNTHTPLNGHRAQEAGGGVRICWAVSLAGQPPLAQREGEQQQQQPTRRVADAPSKGEGAWKEETGG
jgi:hypothetical protein